MKKLFYLFIAFFVVTMITVLYGADAHITVPVIKNHLGGATLKVTFPANSDSAGSQHTDAIFIGNVNDADAYFKVITSAGSDINVLIHFSNDLTTWEAVTAATIDAISNTAEYGDLTRGPRIVNDQTKAEMKKILSEIKSGQFAKEWVDEYRSGAKNFKALYEKDHDCQLETVGKKLRKMMMWIDSKEA